jgi:hypothetical protein
MADLYELRHLKMFEFFHEFFDGGRHSVSLFQDGGCDGETLVGDVGKGVHTDNALRRFGEYYGSGPSIVIATSALDPQ